MLFRSIIGEPQVINISNTSYIISFTEKNNQNYISFVNLKTFSQNEILIPMSIINGFHSMIVQT